MNDPYHGVGLLQFFGVFIKRLFLLFPTGIYPDEIQIAVLIMLSVVGAFLGPFLIYRKMAMMANALSHTILLGITLTYLLFIVLGVQHVHAAINTPILLIAGVVSAVLTFVVHRFLKTVFKVQHETAVGFAFTSLFALGVVLISMISKNAHIGLELIMGNLDAVTLSDVLTIAVAMGVLSFCVILFKRGLITSTVDPCGAALFGFSAKVYDFIVILLTSMITVVCFKAVGVFMTLAFLLIPSLIASRFVISYRKVTLYAALAGALISVVGVAISRAVLTYANLGLSTSGIIVFLFALSYGGVLTLFPSKRFA